MSGFQALEPLHTAELILHTTAGDIRLELFAKQTPQTSRNFLQLCLDGYYDNTIFHRLVPGFIIQGGDPTGTGSGGESSYNDGAPFADEFHSRLKFNRRGLLGMANSGAKNDNGSQFFLTLGETPELNGKNTMFGRVAGEGDTIYNLMKMAEAEVMEGTERPMYPAKVTGAAILLNPFDDMVKRVTEAPRSAPVKDTGDMKKKKAKRKAGKNVLSFGGEDEEDAMESVPVAKKPKFNPTLVSAGKEEPQKLNNTPIPKAPPKQHQKPAVETRAPIDEPDKANTLPERHLKPPPRKRSERSPSPSDNSGSEEDEGAAQSQAFIDRTNDEIAKLKASMKRTVPLAPTNTSRPKTGLEALIPATATRGRKRRPGGGNSKAREEDEALDMLAAFRARLDEVPDDTERASSPTNAKANGHSTNGHSEQKPNQQADDEEATLCDLHFIANCQSCTKWDEQGADDDDDADRGWMAHSLSFAKDRLGKSLEWKRKNEEELLVIDPREKAKDLNKEGRRKERPKESGKSDRRG